MVALRLILLCFEKQYSITLKNLSSDVKRPTFLTVTLWPYIHYRVYSISFLVSTYSDKVMEKIKWRKAYEMLSIVPDT